MNNIVYVQNNEVFIDSLVIAKGTENTHHAIRGLIKKYKNDISEFGTFLILNEESKGGRPLELFLLNEPQATFLMTLLRNSKIVVDFKKELVRQFYAMRKIIQEKQTIQWQETRALSKTNRKMETDAIKEFVSYAIEQGSKNADKYYMIFTKLANKSVGIDSHQRDVINVAQLNNLVLIENIINNIINQEIKKKAQYKDIYQKCKKQIDKFIEITFLQLGA